MIKRALYLVPLAVALTAIGLVFFIPVAHAAAAVTPDDGSLLDMLRPVYDAIMGGQYWLAAALGLTFACAAAKRYAPGRAAAFLHSDVGGTLLVLLMSLGGAVATGLAAAGTGAMTWGLLYAALKVAVGAAGGYSILKKLVIEPLTKSAWWNDKAPAWLKLPMQLVLWAFDKPSALDQAEKAGDEAVKANPGQGASAPDAAGKPTDV